MTRLLRAGSEENTCITAAGQIAAGHEVFILHGCDANPAFAREMVPQARLVGIPALRREISPGRDVQACRQLRAALRGLRPDVVHTHQSKAGILGRFAAASAGTRAVVHGVHILPFLEETGVRRAGYLTAERLAARVTDAFVHVSRGMMSACLGNGVGIGRVHRIVHSGFDIRRFSGATPPENWRELIGAGAEPSRPPVIAMLAALEERKQHLRLIEHLPALLRRHPGVRVVLAGEGGLKDRIAERIAALGLEARVFPLGYRNDPERIIAMADICVLCSRREGLPRSVMQYLAGGRPAVVFHVEGVEQLVGDGRTGLILRQGDWDGLIAALSGILDDPARLARMSARARETDLSPWDARLMAKQTLAVYDEVLEARRETSRPRAASPRNSSA